MKTVANLIPIDRVNNIIERTYFLFVNGYNAQIAKNIITISLWEDTKLSITTNGFKAKKATLKISLFGDIFFKILPIKNTVPKKLTDISALKRKNVGRKNCKPTKDKGTVRKSHVGPYG